MGNGTASYNRLPPELRELIWEFGLPSRRVIQVRSVSASWRRATDGSGKREWQGIFRFCRRHPPPVATRVCRESRAVALRLGFFLSTCSDDDNNDDGPRRRPQRGVWFNPDVDVLYLDRNQRSWLYGSVPAVPGWDRVRHVGLEWRAFFADTPRIRHPALGGGGVDEQGGDDDNDDDGEGEGEGEGTSRRALASSYWKNIMEPFLETMPGLQTLNFVLPKVRYKGGVVWGREPHGSPDLEAELQPLPDAVLVPWQTLTRGGLDVGDRFGQSLPLVAWREIREEMKGGFRAAFADGEAESPGAMKRWKKRRNEAFLGRSKYERGAPDIVGWWLLRVGAPEEYENPSIRMFDA